jgi:hypothetical protein
MTTHHLLAACQPGCRAAARGEAEPDGAPFMDVFSPVRSDWNDTPLIAVAEGRWP